MASITDWKGLKIMNTKLVDHFYSQLIVFMQAKLSL